MIRLVDFIGEGRQFFLEKLQRALAELGKDFGFLSRLTRVLACYGRTVVASTRSSQPNHREDRPAAVPMRDRSKRRVRDTVKRIALRTSKLRWEPL